ncbi:ThiF family adenylyltransferase [Alphaproteobacteria bacterium]|nr:ThiF family adenylyltransferase [Alphaproteobacteria bacterium]
MLNDDDLVRYARQVIIPNFDENGQEKLLNTKCLIVGAGGLGCPVALYASAAGFGHLEIWDEDTIELTNLNRQIAHKNNRIGQNKAKNLAKECLNINPNICVSFKAKHLEISTNIIKFDIIFDCSDNQETKYTLNYLSHKYNKILISGSAIQMEGQLSVWKSGLNNTLPCYECVFPKTTEKAPITNCRDAGIIGPITGIIGSMQVNEAIKEIAVFSYPSMAGYLFLYDGFLQSLDKIKIIKNDGCPTCSS